MIDEQRAQKEKENLLKYMKDLKAEIAELEELHEKARDNYRMLMFSPKVYFDEIDKVLCT